MRPMLNTQRRSSGRLTVLCAMLFAALGGRSTSAPDQEDRSQLSSTLRARRVCPVKLVIPYELTDMMREWAHRIVPRNTNFDRRLPLLVEGLLSEKGLILEYEPKDTSPAPEFCDTGRA